MVTRNEEWWERARKVTPGPQSNLKSPLYPKPRFVVRGKGAHIWDADGKEYIDFFGAHGPSILGYGNEEYVKTLKSQLDNLHMLACLAAQSPLEVEVAEKIVQHVPCAEKVRFCVTGTESVQLAIRLARAHTKRNTFIRFEGHYHGWVDNVLGGVVDDAAIAAGKPPYAVASEQDGFGTEGRDPDAFKQSFKLPWNDIDVLESVLERYGEQVAMILMEAIDCNGGCCPPRPGYLERVRELCTKYGILLCFDEVITGFRVGLSGAQGLFGVTPDIATFGKAMAAGTPVGAVASKQEIMDLLLERRVIGAGTFNGNPYCLAAASATLGILEKDNGAFYKRIEKIQNRLESGLKEVAGRHGIPMLIQGARGVFSFHFLDKPVAYSGRELQGADLERKNKFLLNWAEEGVLVGGDRFHLCDAVTDEDIDMVLESADRAMANL